MPAGTWVVSAYNRGGANSTALFTDFHFTFAQNGTVTATSATDTVTGTWSVFNDEVNNSTQFDLAFPVNTAPWNDLSSAWMVMSQSETLLDLEAGVNTLMFSRE